MRRATHRLSSVALFVCRFTLVFMTFFLEFLSLEAATFGPLRLQSCASQHRWHRRASANGLILERGYTVVLRHYRRMHCNGPLNNTHVRECGDRPIDFWRPTVPQNTCDRPSSGGKWPTRVGALRKNAGCRRNTGRGEGARVSEQSSAARSVLRVLPLTASARRRGGAAIGLAYISFSKNITKHYNQSVRTTIHMHMHMCMHMCM